MGNSKSKKQSKQFNNSNSIQTKNQQKIQSPQQIITQQQELQKDYNSLLDKKRETFQSREDPIVEFVKDNNQESQQQKIDLTQCVDLQLVARQNMYMVSDQEDQIIPVMVSLVTKALQDQGKRAPIDIVCVLDDSGSMSGQKAKLVRQSLKYILKILNEDDRICIIAFESHATILTPFLKNNQANKAEIKKAISFITGKGGTVIPAGIENALWMFQNRKQQNPLSCMFVLTDGQDSGADKTVNHLVQMYKKDKYGADMKYIINSYGYGSDHDADVMSKISQQNSGNFYFVKDYSQISDWFILSLSGLLTVLGEQIEIMIRGTKGYEISQRYGGDKVWNKDNNIFMPHLVQGCHKEYFLEIVVPTVKGQLADNQRNLTVLTADLRGKEVKGEKNNFQISAKLNLQFCNQNEQIDQNQNFNNEMLEKFEVGFFRSKGGVIIGQACELAKQKKYEQAQKMLNDFEKELEGSQFKDASGLQFIKSDVIKSKDLCKEQVFENEGKAFMYKKQNDHIQRIASICRLDDWDDNQKQVYQNFQDGGLQLSDNSGDEQDVGQNIQQQMQRRNSALYNSDDDKNQYSYPDSPGLQQAQQQNIQQILQQDQQFQQQQMIQTPPQSPKLQKQEFKEDLSQNLGENDQENAAQKVGVNQPKSQQKKEFIAQDDD